MTRSKTKRQRSAASRLDKDASIAIVGCGIAGLSTAISLQQAGFSNVSLFERDACDMSRREGFGLTLTYNPKGPLSRLGILEDVAQQDCPSRSHYVFAAPDGDIMGYYGNAFSSPQRGCGQRGNIRIPRQMLQKIMTERFLAVVKKNGNSSSSRIDWDHALTDIRELKTEQKVALEFARKQKGYDANRWFNGTVPGRKNGEFNNNEVRLSDWRRWRSFFRGKCSSSSLPASSNGSHDYPGHCE